MLKKSNDITNVMDAKKSLLPNIDQLIKSDARWKELKKEYDEHKELMVKALEVEETEKLLNMEDIKTDISNIELETMYYKGIEDAIEILKRLNII